MAELENYEKIERPGRQSQTVIPSEGANIECSITSNSTYSRVYSNPKRLSASPSPSPRNSGSGIITSGSGSGSGIVIPDQMQHPDSDNERLWCRDFVPLHLPTVFLSASTILDLDELTTRSVSRSLGSHFYSIYGAGKYSIQANYM